VQHIYHSTEVVTGEIWRFARKTGARTHAYRMDSRQSSRRRPRQWNGPSTGTVVATAAVAYGAYKLANWAWNNVLNEPIQDNAEEDKDRGHTHNTTETNPQMWRMRRQRMTRCRDETAKALEGFLITLRKTVEDKTNTTKETQALKKLRAERGEIDESLRREQEKDLWDIIKVRSVTRMMATAYAHAILFIVLTVQVNLLGGRLFEEQTQNNSSSGASIATNDTAASDRMGSYQASHKFVLMHTYEYFFGSGLVSLISTVEHAVAEVLADWDVLDHSSLHMSRETFEEAIQDIRSLVEGGRSSRPSSRQRRPRSLLRFLMPPSANLEVSLDDELASSILDETFDLLESPVVSDAQKDCLNATFDMMRDQHWGEIFETGSDSARQDTACLWTTKPLASVLTKLKYTSNSFYASPDAETMVLSYCAMMEGRSPVLEMGDVSFN
jgi:peroxin-3